jgi:hypothetical protein
LKEEGGEREGALVERTEKWDLKNERIVRQPDVLQRQQKEKIHNR